MAQRFSTPVSSSFSCIERTRIHTTVMIAVAAPESGEGSDLVDRVFDGTARCVQQKRDPDLDYRQLHSVHHVPTPKPMRLFVSISSEEPDRLGRGCSRLRRTNHHCRSGTDRHINDYAGYCCTLVGPAANQFCSAFAGIRSHRASRLSDSANEPNYATGTFSWRRLYPGSKPRWH